MSFGRIGKLGAATALALALAGCIDVDIDVAVTSPTTARATMTQLMEADFYAMMKAGAENSNGDEEGFCDEGTLTEHDDGSATCQIIEEGPFEGLDLGQDEGGMTFTPAGPGLVRVALPTDDMKAELGAKDGIDEDTRQMIEAYFAGRNITVTVSGAEIVDTNMTLSEDRRSAEQIMPMLDLINGTIEIPSELFAVVRAP